MVQIIIIIIIRRIKRHTNKYVQFLVGGRTQVGKFVAAAAYPARKTILLAQVYIGLCGVEMRTKVNSSIMISTLDYYLHRQIMLKRL